MVAFQPWWDIARQPYLFTVPQNAFQLFPVHSETLVLPLYYFASSDLGATHPSDILAEKILSRVITYPLLLLLSDQLVHGQLVCTPPKFSARNSIMPADANKIYEI